MPVFEVFVYRISTILEVIPEHFAVKAQPALFEWQGDGMKN